MKKLFFSLSAIMLMACTALTFTSCGSDDDNSSAADPTITEPVYQYIAEGDDQIRNLIVKLFQSKLGDKATVSFGDYKYYTDYLLLSNVKQSELKNVYTILNGITDEEFAAVCKGHCKTAHFGSTSKDNDVSLGWVDTSVIPFGTYANEEGNIKLVTTNTLNDDKYTYKATLSFGDLVIEGYVWYNNSHADFWSNDDKYRVGTTGASNGCSSFVIDEITQITTVGGRTVYMDLAADVKMNKQ